jgi:membrane protease YdiL (CAAX protease family)
MLLITILWTKYVEKSSIKQKMLLEEKGIVVLTYIFLVSIILFFIKRPFWEATQLLCIFSILPLFEELFFRVNLLGSMISTFSSHSKNQIIYNKHKIIAILVLNSFLFTIVHKDILDFFTNFYIFNLNMIILVFVRIIFSIAIGNLYLSFNRRMVVPVVSHIAFNLSLFIL